MVNLQKQKCPAGDRLNVNINGRTANQLRSVARKEGINCTEAVCRGVRLLAFFRDEIAKGCEIQVYDPKRDRYRRLILG